MAQRSPIDYNISSLTPESMKVFRDIIAPVLLGLAVFALFHLTLGSFKVYGSSMLPTIEDGEYIMVSKAAYFFGQPHQRRYYCLRLPTGPQIRPYQANHRVAGRHC